MELLEQLQLVEVAYKDEAVIMTFLDQDRGEIREVKFNKQVYNRDTSKFIDDADRAVKVEEWCQEYFNLSFDHLTEALGLRKDIYAYDTFNSLWAVQQVAKFDEDMLGQIFQTDVAEVVEDESAIRIRFDYEGERYESKMSYSKKVNDTYFIDPVKKQKQQKRFEDKFGFPVTEKEQLVGKSVMVEVKKFGVNIYCEIKPFPKKKK